MKAVIQAALLSVAVLLLMGAGDQEARFSYLGHHMMCICGCNQILLECNHVGCAYSEKMRNELAAAVDRGDNNDLILQNFVQEYGTTVIAAPTSTGFNRIAWIMPFLALVLGCVTTALVIRAWKDRPPRSAGVPGVSGNRLDEYRKQAREETEL